MPQKPAYLDEDGMVRPTAATRALLKATAAFPCSATKALGDPLRARVRSYASVARQIAAAKQAAKEEAAKESNGAAAAGIGVPRGGSTPNGSSSGSSGSSGESSGDEESDDEETTAAIAGAASTTDWIHPGEMPPSHFLQAHSNREPSFVDVHGTSAYSASHSSLFHLDQRMRPLPPGWPETELHEAVARAIAAHDGIRSSLPAFNLRKPSLPLSRRPATASSGGSGSGASGSSGGRKLKRASASSAARKPPAKRVPGIAVGVDLSGLRVVEVGGTSPSSHPPRVLSANTPLPPLVIMRADQLVQDSALDEAADAARADLTVVKPTRWGLLNTKRNVRGVCLSVLRNDYRRDSSRANLPRLSPLATPLWVSLYVRISPTLRLRSPWTGSTSRQALSLRRIKRPLFRRRAPRRRRSAAAPQRAPRWLTRMRR